MHFIGARRRGCDGHPIAVGARRRRRSWKSSGAIHRRDFVPRDPWRSSQPRRCMPRWRFMESGTSRGGCGRTRAGARFPGVRSSANGWPSRLRRVGRLATEPTSGGPKGPPLRLIDEMTWRHRVDGDDAKTLAAARCEAFSHGPGYAPMPTTPTMQMKIAVPSRNGTGIGSGRTGASMYMRLATTR